ncbi:MAG: carbohydrate-binding protein, partial [Deltaproteobacteria bacterium]|nr:carbohydrate-binding protein [Deltaproteobacteria bacterium]
MNQKFLLSILFLIFVFTGCKSDPSNSDQNSTNTNSTDTYSTDSNSGNHSDTNDIIYYDSDSNIITGTDSGSINTLQPLRIEAECGFGADKGDCDGKVDGTNSNLPGQDGADTIPLLKEGELVVGYFYAGSWLAFPDIDLTGYTTVTASVASAQTGGSFEIRLDAPDGELVATIEVPNTGSWETFESAEADLSSVTGIHTVYL